MNEQTATLVTQLAAKLGTTSEYLWAVLLKQATIQGWIMLAEYAMTVTVLCLLWRLRTQLSAAVAWTFNEHEGFGILGFIVLAVSGIFWLLACAFAFESMLTAFMNPEYWALNKVLATLKSAK